MKKLILISAVTLTALGCAGKNPFQREANPLNDYPGLEDSVAPHNQKARDQYYVSDVFDISFEDQQESRRILNFVEGQSASQKVSARIYMDGVGFNLQATNLPQGATFTKDTEEGVWTLTWAPAFGFIPANQTERQWDIKIELVPVGGADTSVNASLPSKIERTVPFSLVVRHTEQEPTITKIRGLDNSVSQNAVVPFKVQIKDPAGYSATPPEITWGYDSAQYSNELKRYSGQNGIDWDYKNLKPRQINESTWEYSLVYYADVVAALHRAKAKDGKIDVQFYLQAASTASEHLSPAYSVPLTIVMKAPPAQPTETADQSGGKK
jgi:hypothetical protein